MLQKMEFDGFLYRSGNDNDKRIKCLKLTDKGTKEFLKLLPIVENFKNHTISGISEEDLQTFNNVLNKMIENTLKK
jgi:DNA-binding MarR family transcriptional regulator